MSEKPDNKRDINIEGADKLEREELLEEEVKAGTAEESTDEVEESATAEEKTSERTEDTADSDSEEEENAEDQDKKEPSAEEKLAEMQDRYLRLSAEYDNFRKRTLKEKMELQKSANESLLNAVLPVADDFDRAMQSLEDAQDMKAVKEGMKLIYGKFNGFLDQQGVKEIEAVNKAFDTDLHEAITKIPAPSKKLKGKVVDVIQKGYYLNERVLRFAKVVIGE